MFSQWLLEMSTVLILLQGKCEYARMTTDKLTGSVSVTGDLTSSPGCLLEPVLVFKPHRTVRIVLRTRTHQRLGEVLAAPLKELRRQHGTGRRLFISFVNL